MADITQCCRTCTFVSFGSDDPAGKCHWHSMAPQPAWVKRLLWERFGEPIMNVDRRGQECPVWQEVDNSHLRRPPLAATRSTKPVGKPASADSRGQGICRLEAGR